MNPAHLSPPLVALVLCGAAVAQNDECVGALATNVGAVAFDTTLGTPSAEPWTCVSGLAPDLWFTYTATGGTLLTVSLCGSTYDAALSVYDGACGALNLLGCNDDSCGLQSQLQLVPVAGTTYTIRIGGFATGAGAGTLTITEPLLPPNDECATALELTAAATAFDTSAATLSPEPWSCVFVTSAPDLWFTYVAQTPYPLTFETCGSGFDTGLEVFSGDCGALVLEGCNDDACGLQSRVTVATPTVGATYRVRVGGYSAQSGQGTLTVDSSRGPNCFSTTFVSNNGGSVGGAVYFDFSFTQDVVLTHVDVNYSALAGTPVGLVTYVTPGTSVGVEANPAAWFPVAFDDGTALSAGTNAPTRITWSSPVIVPAGNWGVALVAINSGHRYTNGTATNTTAMTPDGVISFMGGKASNVPFTAPLFSPRIWNGSLCYSLRVGTNYCGPAVTNSTGGPGLIQATGSANVAENSLVIAATELPAFSSVLFLTSPTQGLWVNPGGSAGVLCLGGSIGRGVGGRVFQTPPTGNVATRVDLQRMPTPILVYIPVLPGETYNFQAWYRDQVGGVAVSNFTDAVSVLFD